MRRQGATDSAAAATAACGGEGGGARATAAAPPRRGGGADSVVGGADGDGPSPDVAPGCGAVPLPEAARWVSASSSGYATTVDRRPPSTPGRTPAARAAGVNATVCGRRRRRRVAGGGESACRTAIPDNAGTLIGGRRKGASSGVETKGRAVGGGGGTQ
ncbi:hypothetical protein I4F81_011539 [Pyropia yezoensis]|uniref:Uncharacterized protein n=1 Tax=Pyropia yezoensis TaxID=2788 RepID=A0ACC3CFV4_PYRYE|nr:hypothetical protein I4F81_011539 [Neopyropia yezoensis]